MDEETNTAGEAERDKEFHPYVRLLVARMRSNPNDFSPRELLDSVLGEEFLTEDEKAAIYSAKRDAYLTQLHTRLMSKILDPDGEMEKNKRAERFRVDKSGNVGISTSTLAQVGYSPAPVPQPPFPYGTYPQHLAAHSSLLSAAAQQNAQVAQMPAEGQEVEHILRNVDLSHEGNNHLLQRVKQFFAQK